MTIEEIRPKVLIVDDREENLLAFKRILSGMEMDIFEAKSGDEALLLTLNHDFALILLDVQMPEMDGFEVAEILRCDRKTEHVPIIFLTANFLTEKDAFAGYQSGAIDYITKPVQPQILLSKVKVLLQLYRHNQILRSETEFKYRTLFNNVSDGLFLYSLDAKKGFPILEVNANACIMTGHERNGLTGLDIAELFRHCNDEEYITDLLWCEDDDQTSRFEASFSRSEGSSFDAEVTVHSFGFNGVRYAIAAVRDITDRKKTEMELVEAKKQAQLSNLMKDQFIANVSHELRTPLNGIMGMARLLEKTGLNGVQTEYLNLLLNASSNLISIVDDILDFSRMKSGELVLKKTSFSFVELLERLVSVFRNDADRKNLELELVVPESGSDLYQSYDDPGRVEQIFSNLISNAIKYTESGRVVVSIQDSERLEGEMRRVCIVVSDTGVGIPEDKMDLIFDRFFQIDHTYKKTSSGVGIGLSIVKQLVELLEGNMEVSSEQDRGTVFEVHLPLHTPPVATQPMGVEKPAVRVPEGLRVLLAEDECINAIYFKRLLSTMGCQCQWARDGQEALDLFEPDRFDLVLMDIGMPRLSGIEATEKIRSTYADCRIPIIAITAHSFASDLKKYRESGIDDCVTKPISEAKLKAVLAHFSQLKVV